LSATSTLELFSEEPGVVRIVDAGNGARHIEHGLGDEAQRQVERVVAGDGGDDVRFARAGRLQHAGFDGMPFVDHLRGEFLVQMRQQVAAVLDQPHLVPLVEQ
jgi:hypothetical protein